MSVYQTGQSILKRWTVPFLAVILLSMFFRMQKVSGWDEAFYMSQMSSAILDGDLMLQNDLLTFPNDIGERIRSVSVLRPDGVHINAFSIGPAVFYGMVMIPVYMSGAERFGLGFRQAAAVWVAFFLVLAAIGMNDLLKKFGFDTFPRYAAIAVAVFSTPIFRYGFRYYLSSHFLATVLTIFIILFWMKWFDQPCFTYAWAAGLVTGWLVITRWQAALFLICLVPPILFKLFDKNNRSRRLAGLIIALFSIILVAGIQSAAWKIQFGEWLCRPVNESFMEWSSPQWWPFLMSGYHGLIPWAPGLLLGFMGLLFMGFLQKSRMNKWLIWGFVFAILIQVYVNACVWDWWGGSSYGPRRMTFLFAPIAVGWAFIMSRIKPYLRIALVLIMVAWGIFTACSFYEGVDDLTLLFTGEPDSMRPARSEVPDGQVDMRWQHWKNGYRKIGCLDFRLVDTSRVRYRRQGLLVLFAVAVFSGLISRFSKKSRRVRCLILSFVTAYLVVVFLALAFWFPSNVPWQSHWAAIVRNQPAEFPEEDVPDGYDLSVRFMRTYHLLKNAGNHTVLLPKNTYFEGFPGMTISELSDHALN